MTDDRVCPSCQVVLPVGRTVCPKCGKTVPWGETGKSPWQLILWGSVSLGLAVLLFVWISWKEESGGTMRVPWLLAIAYYIGGKWTVSGVLGLLGCFLVGVGLVKWLREEEEEKGSG